MDLGLKGKNILVTAASGGIGKAVAEEYAKEGANLMLFARSEDKLKAQAEDLAKAYGVRTAYLAGDVTQAGDIEAVFKKMETELGAVYALINNTGGPPPGPYNKFADDEWKAAFELTLLNIVRTARYAVPVMQKSGGGRIVNIASSSIKRVIDNLSLSNTFRMAIVGLSKSMAREHAADNIIVNVLGPGKIHTSRVDQVDGNKAQKAGQSLEDFQKSNAAAIPAGRYGTVEEFAKLTVFLGSPVNSYTTGQSLVVDGGMVAAY